MPELDENGLIDSEYPASVSAGPSPLPRFTHPEHGELEIYGFDGRSKLCRRLTDRVEFRIGTRVVNRFRSDSTRTLPLLAETASLPSTDGLDPESLSATVTNVLERMPDTSERVRIARDIWAAADAFLTT